MIMDHWGRSRRLALSVLVGSAVLAASYSPAAAQNRKRAWEIFIYFGEYGGQTVPSAIQQAVVNTYRLDPFTAYPMDPNFSIATDPNTERFCPVCKNLGFTGPSNVFIGPITQSGSEVFPDMVDPCPLQFNGQPDPDALDPNNPYRDECDDDIEARYKYNVHGIVTNGEVQRNDSEFLLGGRLGYNVTRHWEVEIDLGFAKQRLDMTRNLLPLLTEKVSNPADPWFERLADFYEFTWANIDFLHLGYNPGFDPNDFSKTTSILGMKEIPNVPHRRFSQNAGADIPAVLPMPFADAERFDDATDFINRVFLDPTAFRNRANQINIDIFSAGLSGVYNFNTKPDSRIVPYLQAGIGRWMRSFDSPYKGENSDYLTYGGGVRFFVNEIFSFRAELRSTLFRQDEATITATHGRQNLLDNGGRASCYRDQRDPEQVPPIQCSDLVVDEINTGDRRFPLWEDLLFREEGARPGGSARLTLITETDNFWEARIGFDVLLGGK